jgi:hypothetical protein
MSKTLSLHSTYTYKSIEIHPESVLPWFLKYSLLRDIYHIFALRNGLTFGDGALFLTLPRKEKKTDIVSSTHFFREYAMEGRGGPRHLRVCIQNFKVYNFFWQSKSYYLAHIIDYRGIT